LTKIQRKIGRFLAPFCLAILGFGKGIFSPWGFLAGLGIFGGLGSFWHTERFLAGFKEFFPPLAILVGVAEIEQATKKVGNDIL
jgi:hypothetical protein